ncbi:uncharacterized protein [Periplaneta americana]|uniref:uncharacterized protein n=1 Tax=Periplaneta americana TaxID=6978 RepID=UPI0037E7D6C9
MVLFLLAVLVPNLILVASECEIGPSVKVNLDKNKFLGRWYYVYHSSNQKLPNLGCLEDDFMKGDNGYKCITTGYDKTMEALRVFKGEIMNWTDESFVHNYDSDATWDGIHYYLGLNYDKFLIITTCLDGRKKSTIYVGFRSKDPSDEDIKAAFAEMDKNGGNSKELEKFSSCDKMK